MTEEEKKKARAQARDAYDAATAEAWAVCEAAKAPALAAYDEAEAQAWAAFEARLKEIEEA